MVGSRSSKKTRKENGGSLNKVWTLFNNAAPLVHLAANATPQGEMSKWGKLWEGCMGALLYMLSFSETLKLFFKSLFIKRTPILIRNNSTTHYSKQRTRSFIMGYAMRHSVQ